MVAESKRKAAEEAENGEEKAEEAAGNEAEDEPVLDENDERNAEAALKRLEAEAVAERDQQNLAVRCVRDHSHETIHTIRRKNVLKRSSNE